VLAADQEALSSRFARSRDDKWTDVAFTRNRFGAPVLAGNIATLECRAWKRYDGGDHVIVVAEVLALEHKIFRDPLLFFRGRYAGIGAVASAAPPAELGWPLSMHY
jgi:flavin reductase (DIM6/NTAB) family NADH-FMN oxidoreductase RutF